MGMQSKQEEADLYQEAYKYWNIAAGDPAQEVKWTPMTKVHQVQVGVLARYMGQESKKKWGPGWKKPRKDRKVHVAAKFV